MSRHGVRATGVAAAVAVLATIPLGWALYVAKLLSLADRETLYAIDLAALLVATIVASVVVIPRPPPRRLALDRAARFTIPGAAAPLLAFAFAPVAGWIRLVGTLVVLVAAAGAARVVSSRARSVAVSLGGVAFAVAAAELLLIYGFYPLLPVAVAAIVALLAAVTTRRGTVV